MAKTLENPETNANGKSLFEFQMGLSEINYSAAMTHWKDKYRLKLPQYCSHLRESIELGHVFTSEMFVSLLL